MSSEVRDYKLIVLIGRKAEGKSTVLRMIGDNYIEENPDRRVLMHDSSNSLAFVNQSRWFITDIDEIIDGKKIEGSHTHSKKWKIGKRIIKTISQPYYEPNVERLERKAIEDAYKKRGETLPASLKRAFANEAEKTAYYLFKYFKNGLLMMDEAYEWVGYTTTSWARSLVLKHRNNGLDVVLVFHSFALIPKAFRPHISQYIVFKTGDEDIDGFKWFSKRNFPAAKKLYEAYEYINNRPRVSKKERYYQDFAIVNSY